MAVVFVIIAFLVHLSGEPTFSETLGFDHGGQLELSGLFIFYTVALALIIGAPLGAWLALRNRGYGRPRWPTVIAVLILAPVVGMFAISRVPSSPGDPVLEPYVLLVSAFLAGLIGRLITTSTISQDSSRTTQHPNTDRI